METGKEILRKGRGCKLIALLCICLIAALWVLALERVGHERREAMETARRSNSNLAVALEEHTVRTLSQAEQALMFMKHEFETHGKVVRVQSLADEGIIRGGSFLLSFVVDREGRVLGDDGIPGEINLADREYFAYHRDHLDQGTRIAAPTIGRMTGRPVIALSRRANAPDGGFNGVYIVGVDPNHFLGAYERFDLGREGLVQLVGLDGIARARRASGQTTFGDDMAASSILKHAQEASSGSFISAGRLEGVVRYSSFRRLEDYPLVVGVGTSVEELLGRFSERRRMYVLAALAGTLILITFASALIGAMRRQQRAIRDLAANEQRYRATFDQAAVGVVNTGLDGRLIDVNRKFCEMLGYAIDELRAKRFADVTHPDDLIISSAYAMQLLDAPEGDVLPEIEKRYLRKDGGILWATVVANLARSPDGAPQYYVTVVKDITQRKAAESRLLEQLDELRRFQKVSVDRELRMMALEAQVRHLRTGHEEAA